MQEVVTHIDSRFDELTPILKEISDFGSTLEGEIDELGDSLAPISRLAGRLPGNRKRGEKSA